MKPKFPTSKAKPAKPIFSMGAILPKKPNKNSQIESSFASNWNTPSK